MLSDLNDFVMLAVTGSLFGIKPGTPVRELRDKLGQPTGEIMDGEELSGMGYGHLFFGVTSGQVQSISIKWDHSMPKYVAEAQKNLDRMAMGWYSRIGTELTLSVFIQLLREYGAKANQIIPEGGDWGSTLIEVESTGAIVSFDERGLLEGIWLNGKWPYQSFRRTSLRQ